MSPVRSVRLIAVVMVIAACQDPAAPKRAGAPAALTALPRALTGSETAVVAANNRFAFHLLRAMPARGVDSNIVISPLSASMALGMAMNGAAGATYGDMRAALGFDSLSMAAIDTSYLSLITLLRGLDPQVDFRLANSVWIRQGFSVKPTFLQAVGHFFDARAQNLDFSTADAPKTINAWVNEATNGKIPTIVDGIPPNEMLYLINAIYFLGSWRDGFNVSDTRSEAFHLASGTDADVMMMHRQGPAGWTWRSDVSVIDLPYGNSAFTMTILLPNPGHTLDEMVAGLTATRWDSLTSSIDGLQVELAMPRFSFRGDYRLNEPLSDLGMARAFSDAADFSEISDVAGLAIDAVKQKTFIKVNEEGTEAAAVTSVSMRVTSVPAGPQVVRIDRPFLFALRERFSGTIFFVGLIGRPSEN
jgi:serine protease inhibitor